MEKQIVRFFDTYNTMVRQQVFKIVNKSDHVLTYMCMKHECVYYGKLTFFISMTNYYVQSRLQTLDDIKTRQFVRSILLKNNITKIMS